jgi:hypothetical protein
MRFVSKSANFHAGNFRNAKEGIGTPENTIIGGKTVTSGSQAYIVAEAIPIAFSQQGLLQADIDAALAHWKHFPGLPVEEDEVTPANPVENGRIGVWDSEEWQAEHKLSDQAENLLLLDSAYGIEYVVVEAVKAAKPWPSYDDAHHNKVASLATELGLVPEALAYELSKEKPRPSVVEQLEAAAANLESGEFVAA